MTAQETGPRRGGMVRNALHLGLGQIVTTVLTIMLSATVAHALSGADFGLLYLVTSIAGFAYVVVDWGHGPLIVRETARHPERAGVLVGSVLMVRAIATVIVCLIAVATTWVLGYDVRTRVLTGALILAWLPQYLGLSFSWAFRGYERMDREALLNVALKLATLVGSIVCFVLGGGLLGLVLAWSLAGALTLVLAVAMYRRLQLPEVTATMAVARELLRDGTSFLAMSLAVAVSPFFNANILFKLTSPTVVGWFGAASNIMGTLIAPASILGMTMYPRLSRFADNPEEFGRTFRVSFRLLLLLAILGGTGTYLFAEVPVQIIYSLDKFGPSVDTLRAFAPAVMLLYVDVFLGTAIVAAGKAGKMAGAKVASIALTVVLAFFLVPFFQTRWSNGGLGVAYATVIGEVLMVGTAGFLIREAIDRSAISDACRGLIVGGATILLFRLLPAISPFLGIPLCVIVFAGLSLLIGALKRSDVEMLLAPFRKQKPAADAPLTPDQ
jgi:O-antigen/teichoic acid export membrane protein